MIFFFFFNDTATTEIYTLSLHDALPICRRQGRAERDPGEARQAAARRRPAAGAEGPVRLSAHRAPARAPPGAARRRRHAVRGKSPDQGAARAAPPPAPPGTVAAPRRKGEADQE